MPGLELLAYAIGLLLYPGAVIMLALGALAETGASWALVPNRGPLAGLRSLGRSLRAATTRQLPLFATLAALMAVIAAAQVTLPFSPIPASERNLLLAGLALVAGAWITACWGWDRQEFDPAFTVLMNAAWLVALLAPTLATANLRPQELGALVLPALTPVKLAAGVLYLLCLPALLQLVPESSPQGVPGTTRRAPDPEEGGFTVVRALLWLPYCGLFASIFFPPQSDDLAGVARFLLLTLGAGALALAVAANLIHWGSTITLRRYGFVIAALSLLTVGITAASDVFPNML